MLSELDGLKTMCFSGLRYHGGFPPTSPPDLTPEPWSYRFVLVCYPPKSMLDSSARLCFGALPKGALFSLPPEMTDPK